MVIVKRALGIAVVLALVASSALSTGSVLAADGILPLKAGSSLTSPPGGHYVPDQIIVRFKETVLRSAQANLNEKLGTKVIYSSFAGFHVLQIPEGKTVPDMVRAYSRNPLVENVQPNYIYHATWTPNDSYYAYQWHFDQIDLEAAWDLDTVAPLRGGDPGIVVAVVDTGIAYETYNGYVQAPDLAGTSFVAGWDFVNNDAHPNDDHGHGTHVCGTIAQSTDNHEGVAGIAFCTSIMPVKVLKPEWQSLGHGIWRWGATGITQDVVEGIRYAVDNGADIINLSLGGSSPDPELERAVAYAYNRGVLVIASSGNSGDATPQYPASYDDYVISVGATRYDRSRAAYSSYGSHLDIVAPGGDLSIDQNADGQPDGVRQQTLSQPRYPNSADPASFEYGWRHGTSMAAPHVAGVAALILAKNPSLRPDQVRQALESTATGLGYPGWDEVYGWGLLNAAAAVAWAGQPDIVVSPLGFNLTLTAGTIESYTLTISNDHGPALAYSISDWEVGRSTTRAGVGSLMPCFASQVRSQHRSEELNSCGAMFLPRAPVPHFDMLCEGSEADAGSAGYRVRSDEARNNANLSGIAIRQERPDYYISRGLGKELEDDLGMSSDRTSSSVETRSTTKTWYVDDDLVQYPGANFAKIQDAVNAASSGDTIIVYPGVYIENVTVGKDNLTISSHSGADVTIVQAASTRSVFAIRGSDVSISGFTVRGGSGALSAGIEISPWEANNTIADNNIASNHYGIWLWESNANTIKDNKIFSNESDGIWVIGSRNNITGNTISDNRGMFSRGIRLWAGSDNNSITGNTISNNSMQGLYMFDNAGNAISGNNISLNGESGIEIWDSCSNNITDNSISGNSVISRGGAGIDVMFASTDNIISGNSISSNNGDGIYMSGVGSSLSSNNTIIANTIFSNGRYGVALLGSVNNIVAHNVLSGNNHGLFAGGDITVSYSRGNQVTHNTISGGGITVSYSRGNQVTHNTISGGGWYGIHVWGDDKSHFDNLIDSTNTVNGKPVYYYFDRSDEVIENLDTTHLTLAYCSGFTIRNSHIDSGDGLRLLHSSGNVIHNNDISSNNVYGVYLYYSNDNSITGNIMSLNEGTGVYLHASAGNDIGGNTVSENSEDGVFLWEYCDNNIITGNEVLSNGGIGVYLRWSTYNVITDNNISLNDDFGIYLYVNASSNRIYHNNITDNVQNAGDYSNRINDWDNGYPSGGNYWSDYTGSDSNGDGIGDTPYFISGTAGAKDDCPLTMPYGGNDPPNRPSNPWPVDNAGDVSLDIVLTWAGGDPDPMDTVTYDIYFGTSSSPPLVADDQSRATYDPAALAYNTNYYWRVVATDCNGASAAGPLWNFTTRVVTGDCPWLDENPKSGSVPAGGINSISLTINTAGLRAGSTYGAEIVIDSNDPDESPMIIPVTLHVVAVANNPPNIPSSPFPPNNAAAVPTDAHLCWIGGDPDAGDAVTYDVYFGTSSTPQLVSDNQVATMYDPGTLAGNTQYHWQIVAVDNHGASTVGPLWSFTTATAKIGGETREVNCAFLPGVNITLYQGSVQIGSTVTNATGSYELAVTQLGDYNVTASRAGFRSRTRTISVTQPTVYTLDFAGNYGLIPNAPNMSYVLACINRWKFGEPPCQLNMSTVLAVINAWKFPMSQT